MILLSVSQVMYLHELLACIDALLHRCDSDCGSVSLQLFQVLITVHSLSVDPQLSDKVRTLATSTRFLHCFMWVHWHISVAIPSLQLAPFFANRQISRFYKSTKLFDHFFLESWNRVQPWNKLKISSYMKRKQKYYKLFYQQVSVSGPRDIFGYIVPQRQNASSRFFCCDHLPNRKVQTGQEQACTVWDLQVSQFFITVGG